MSTRRIKFRLVESLMFASFDGEWRVQVLPCRLRAPAHTVARLKTLSLNRPLSAHRPSLAARAHSRTRANATARSRRATATRRSSSTASTSRQRASCRYRQSSGGYARTCRPTWRASSRCDAPATRPPRAMCQLCFPPRALSPRRPTPSLVPLLPCVGGSGDACESRWTSPSACVPTRASPPRRPQAAETLAAEVEAARKSGGGAPAAAGAAGGSGGSGGPATATPKPPGQAQPPKRPRAPDEAPEPVIWAP